ncbi:MAG: exodeoxyribonuclease III [Proteobacteria bacterium]|nr:MAG: exodeoxyribonuclease III [Pseudomonadota bacterium]
MRIITLNANGIRAAERKGFFPWLKQQQADFVCIQETKAQLHQLPPTHFIPQGYHYYQADAEKKGYSGVALLTKQQPIKVEYGIGFEPFDNEGRWLAIELADLIVASLYMPSGSSKDSRQEFKYLCMNHIDNKIKQLKSQAKPFIICADWNIAHKKIDIKNWQSNQKNSGFLPEERAWISKLLDEHQLIDAFRQINQQAHQYSWWSNRGQAWQNNTGWRLDYQLTSKDFKDTVQNADIYKDQRFSDHAPVTIEYAI